MAFTLVQTIFLVLLLFTFYGCLKSIIVYKAKRQFKYLVLLAFFFIISPHLWMKAYNIRMQEFLVTFQFIITLVPLVMFLIYDHWEMKRIQEQKDKIRIKTFFERYVNPKIIDELLGQKTLELKGKRQTVTIFFMDIRGFTKLSERLPAEKVVLILNRYFDIATSVIFKHDGTVDKFVGDAVMAVFNAPTHVKNHELKAVKSAFEIQNAINEWGKIKVGIGIHTGEAIIGNIGSKHMMDYTAIGDTVNVAARLEGQTNAGDIVVSKEVYEKVKLTYKTRHKTKVKLKGKKSALQIYRYKTSTERY